MRLREQLQTMQMMVKQRGAMAVAQFAEGLNSLLQDARAGNPDAASLLRQLSKLMAQVDDLDSPLTVVRND